MRGKGMPRNALGDHDDTRRAQAVGPGRQMDGRMDEMMNAVEHHGAAPSRTSQQGFETQDVLAVRVQQAGSATLEKARPFDRILQQ